MKGKAKSVRRATGSRESRPRMSTAAEEQAETTRIKKVAFLAAFANCGQITKASETVGINPDTHYEWRKDDPKYSKDFADLRERVADMLEDLAVAHAIDGVPEPMIGRIDRDLDGVITHVRRYDHRLLEFLLKGNRPAKFRERYEVSGPDGGPIETHELSESERAARINAVFDAARARRDGQALDGAGEVGTPPGSADSSGEDGSV